MNVKGCPVDGEPVRAFEGDDFLSGEVVGDGSSWTAGLLDGDAVVLDAPAKRVWDFATNNSGLSAALPEFTCQSVDAANTTSAHLDSRVDSNE